MPAARRDTGAGPAMMFGITETADSSAGTSMIRRRRSSALAEEVVICRLDTGIPCVGRWRRL